MGAPVSSTPGCGLSSLFFLSPYFPKRIRDCDRVHATQRSSRRWTARASSFVLPLALASAFALGVGLPTGWGVGSAFAADDVVGRDIEVTATQTCLGIRWYLSGDDNLTSTVTVQYRTAASTDVWHEAQPLLRVEPGSWSGDGIDPGNLHAGSIFDLTPDTDYEIRLELADPDGGYATESRLARTRAIPGDPAEPRFRYVVPGSGGGSGAETDPFRGIAAANAAAAPGDVFLLQPGTYAGVSVLSARGTEAEPIVWRGVDPESVVFDGANTAKPVVDFPGSRFVHLENVSVIRPRQMAIRGSATSGVVVRGCTIDSSNLTGVEKGGIYFLGPNHTNVYVADNTVRGPIRWEDGRNDDAYGIYVTGRGHVVRNNEIRDWWDGILVGHGEPEAETSDCDVFANEIHNCTDDGIETDGSRHNVRVVGNRFTNVLCGISAQPVYGGPMYAIRNVVYNYQLKPLKYQVWPTGLIVFSNTFVGADPRGWGDGEWRNAVVRNNLFVGGSGPGHSGDPIALDARCERADIDYNGWHQAEPDRFARFNGTYYETLGDFQEALDMSWHAVHVDHGVFRDAEEPELGPYLGQGGYLPGYEPGSQDLRLYPGSIAEEAGVWLANITEEYAGIAPDLGAYESGRPFPTYGPRTDGPNDPSDVDTIPALTDGLALMAYPNPFSTEATITFTNRAGSVDGVSASDPRGQSGEAKETALEAHASLKVYSVTGRLVRTLRQASGTPSTGAFVWDGTDESGREAGTGLYLVRLEDAEGRTVAQSRVIRAG
ncbi:MAG: right-handed parallel beta-helix repeat-containing protein [Candidatus Eisenbacteria bacterium]